MGNGNCFITLEELASTCHMHAQSIQMHRAGARTIKLLNGLPAPVRTRPFLLWLRSDIESWLAGKSTLTHLGDVEENTELQAVEPTVFRRKPGRPKKKLAGEAGRVGGAS